MSVQASKTWILAWLVCVSTCLGCGGGSSSSSPPPTEPETQPPVAEVVVDQSADVARFVDQSGRVHDYSSDRIACEQRGWTKTLMDIQVGEARHIRKVLHQSPSSGQWRGTLILMHGGGGHYANWCNDDTTARGMMVDAALDNDFAVYLLDSTDFTPDQNDALCGKVWDDNILPRDNHDVPYVEGVIRNLIPQQRPVGIEANVFLMGFSSGGFMTTRAATELNTLVAGFIPIATGSPYGWHRDCSFASGRNLVAGVGRDNDTILGISRVQACGPIELDLQATYPNELEWLDGGAVPKPTYLKVQHFDDAIVDFSCHSRHVHQLGENDYSGSVFEFRPLNTTRANIHHSFLPEFISPIIGFLLSITP